MHAAKCRFALPPRGRAAEYESRATSLLQNTQWARSVFMFTLKNSRMSWFVARRTASGESGLPKASTPPSLARDTTAAAAALAAADTPSGAPVELAASSLPDPVSSRDALRHW